MNEILAQPNGSDLLLFFWSKAMEENRRFEDSAVLAVATTAYHQARRNGYQLPVAQ